MKKLVVFFSFLFCCHRFEWCACVGCVCERLWYVITVSGKLAKIVMFNKTIELVCLICVIILSIVNEYNQCMLPYKVNRTASITFKALELWHNTRQYIDRNNTWTHSHTLALMFMSSLRAFCIDYLFMCRHQKHASILLFY